MAKFGKILALIAGILTLLGTFVFSLFTVGSAYNYGIGGILNILNIWTGGVWGIVAAVGYCLYLLAFVFIFIGIKSRFFAILGSLFPIAAVVFVFLGAYDVWTTPLVYLGGFMGVHAAALWTYIPLSFPSLLLGGFIDLGTWIIGVGGLLALISGFLTREY